MDYDLLVEAVQRLRLRVVEKMRDVEAGQPLCQAAAEIGMMPFEFCAIYETIVNRREEKPPSTIE